MDNSNKKQLDFRIIEKVIMQHPAVADCVVKEVTDPLNHEEKIAVAFVVLKSEIESNIEIKNNIKWFAETVLTKEKNVNVYHFSNKLRDNG